MQEYEQIEKTIGAGRVKAIDEYIAYCNSNGKSIEFANIVYNQKEYELFDKWFKESINPFKIMKNYDESYSILLNQEDFNYDWSNRFRNKINKLGNGYNYEYIFMEYIRENFDYLDRKLVYDSEFSMFCASCSDEQDIEETAYELSKLYKNEIEMKKLINNALKFGDIQFSNNVNM